MQTIKCQLPTAVTLRRSTHVPVSKASARVVPILSRRTVAPAAASNGKSHDQNTSKQKWLSGAAAALAAVLIATSGPSAIAEEADARLTALSDFIQLQESGKIDKSPKVLEDFRNRYKYKRNLDGRVSVQGSQGWYDVRLDMGAEGTVLLRQASSSELFMLQADSLKQVDLSDDKVVLMMFADGSWEEALTPLEIEENGKPMPVKLTPQEFRDIFTLLADDDMEQEAGK